MEQAPAAVPAAPVTSEVPVTPQTPIAPPPVAPPPIAQPKSHALLGFLVVVLALGTLGVGGYFGYRQYRSKTQEVVTPPTSEETTPEASPAAVTEPTAVPDETVDWQLYENATYKFSFKYPKNFKLAEVAKTIKESLITEALAFKLNLTQDIYVAQAQNPEISLEVAKTTRTLDEILIQIKAKVKEMAEGVTPESPYYGQAQAQIKSSEIVTIGSFTALKIDRYGGPGAPNPNYLEYYVKTPEGYLLVFSARYGTDPGGSESVEKAILSQLITTLKWLE